MTILPNNVLKCLSPTEKNRLGKAGLTTDEAQERFEAKNERDLQRLISNYLRLNNLPFLQDSMHKRRTGTIGWPDFTVFIHGHLLLFEVKFGKGKVSPEQAALHAQLAQQGFPVHIVTSFEQAHKLVTEALTAKIL